MERRDMAALRRLRELQGTPKVARMLYDMDVPLHWAVIILATKLPWWQSAEHVRGGAETICSARSWRLGGYGGNDLW